MKLADTWDDVYDAIEDDDDAIEGVKGDGGRASGLSIDMGLPVSLRLFDRFA